jgi:L-lactate dehydrogenase complex protein LldE
MRIALFITCVNDLLYPQTGIAVTRVLERLGPCGVPADQTCCGHANKVGTRATLPLISHYQRVFDVTTRSFPRAAPVRRDDPRAVPASSCPPPLGPLAPTELSELLVDVLGVTDVGAGTRTASRTTDLSWPAAAAPGRQAAAPVRACGTLTSSSFRAARCCGFGGVLRSERRRVRRDAQPISARASVDWRRDIGAVDNSCLTHIGGGLSRA